MPDSQNGPNFDLLASSIRADSSDLRTYLDVVAGKLADSLPGSVKVERDGGMFSRQHRVRRVTLSLDGRAYALAWTGTDLQASIDSGLVPVDRWALALGRHLADHAQAETQTRAAMEALLEGRLPVQVLTRPDPASIVARHPVTSFSPDSVLEVDAADSIVVLAGGRAVGPIGQGRHRVGDIVGGTDPAATAVGATVYFVSGVDRPNLRFGGVIGDVRTYGSATVRVSDPVGLVRLLAGPAGGAIGDDLVAGILRDSILKVLASDQAAGTVAPVGGAGLAARTLDRLREPGAMTLLEVLSFESFSVSQAEPAQPPAAPVPQGCPRCGSQNTPGSRFCAQCGGPLPAP